MLRFLFQVHSEKEKVTLGVEFTRAGFSNQHASLQSLPQFGGPIVVKQCCTKGIGISNQIMKHPHALRGLVLRDKGQLNFT
ncbi:Uncharacterized protein TCM_015426 [Theobroma cacao]|uniref:Uncharacterized protein n=1 Tax=Theobroma cacao TaxID=3641 RepID=A0A061G953_THECC|nr:Uncharacterized protein TCM_015426 [Theobroma cacao]